MAVDVSAAPIERHLHAWTRGDRRGRDAALTQLYPQVRRAAARLCRLSVGSSGDPEVLAHDAHLRLARLPRVQHGDVSYVLNLARAIMRNLLRDGHKAMQRRKRGGPAVAVSFDERAHGGVSDRSDAAPWVGAALEVLREIHPRRAEVVRLRCIAGLTIAEVAEELGVTTRTVDRDWRLARAWLRRELADP